MIGDVYLILTSSTVLKDSLNCASSMISGLVDFECKKSCCE